MGVELQHVAVYGYEFEGRFPWDRMYEEGGEETSELADKLMEEYSVSDAEPGDFVLCQDPRGGDYLIAGIAIFVTDSTRWNGPQVIDPTVMDDEVPPPGKIAEMERIIERDFRDYVERKHDEPKHIVFTHNW